MKTVSLLCVALSASVGQAQMNITARNSTVSYDWLYGFAGDIRLGSDALTDTSLLPAGSAEMIGSSTGDGYYPPSDHEWSATVTWNLAHSYAITGGLGSASRIESSGLAALTSTESGATSGVNAINPGNLLTIEFGIADPQNLRLFGSLDQNGPHNRNGSAVYVYRSNGAGGWNLMLIEGTANSAFDVTRFFDAGAYKIESGAAAMAGGIESTHAAWNYTLEVVPAPSAAALVACVWTSLVIRRRRAVPAVGWPAQAHS